MVQISNEVPPASLNVYLLAENRLLRETLARLLQKRGGISVVGVSRYTESSVAEICASRCSILLMDSMATAEEMILTKLEWNRITPSERQVQDALNVAVAQWPQLDQAYLRK